MSVLPQRVSRNWHLKLAALGLAVFLWAVVTSQPRNRQLLHSVPVQVVVNDPEWVVEGLPSPAMVSVQLGGPTGELLQLARVDAGVLRIPIDLVAGRDTVVRLRPEWLSFAGRAGLVVETFVPTTVSVRLEPALSQMRPVSLSTRNALPAEFALAQPFGLEPQMVRVHGPARVVEGLDSVPLEPLDISQVRESGLLRVRIDTSGFANVTFEPATVQVAVRLERAVERLFEQVPVVVESSPALGAAAFVVVPEMVSVTLRGAATPVGLASADLLAGVIPASELEGLAVGSVRAVGLRFRGVPGLVAARSSVDSVRVLRVPDGGGPDGEPPVPDTTGPAGQPPVPDTTTGPAGQPPVPDTTTGPAPDGGRW